MTHHTLASMTGLSRMPDFLCGLQRRWKRRAGKTRISPWYTNRSGNLAARASVVQLPGELIAYIEIRRGTRDGEYSYTMTDIASPVTLHHPGRLFTQLCREATHLAQLRYRFTPA